MALLNAALPWNGAAAQAQPSASINTVRVIAFTLLVSYHVVGPTPTSGLEISYPHVLRFFADFFVGIRMPIFAVIAGYVYAIRPVRLDRYSGFVTGKLRRLFVPGVISSLIFLFISNIMNNDHSRPLLDTWTVLAYSYVHYWYLQAMLVIFLVVGLCDGLLKGRATLWLWVIAMALALSPFNSGTTFFSLHRVLDLLPHFMTGVVIQRYWGVLYHYRRILVGLCLLVIVGFVVAQVLFYQEHGVLISSRRTLLVLMFSTCSCLMMMLYIPSIRPLEVLAPFAFTIYLYHVLGTAGMRETLHLIGIYNLTVTFILGLMAGIVVPIVIHRLAEKWSLSRRLMLGAKS